VKRAQTGQSGLKWANHSLRFENFDENSHFVSTRIEDEGEERMDEGQ